VGCGECIPPIGITPWWRRHRLACQEMALPAGRLTNVIHGVNPRLHFRCHSHSELPIMIANTGYHKSASFSERELTFTFAIVVRPSVYRLSSVCHLSVTFVRPIQTIGIFDNVSTPLNTVVIWRHPGEMLWRSFQRNSSVGGVKPKRCSQI